MKNSKRRRMPMLSRDWRRRLKVHSMSTNKRKEGQRSAKNVAGCFKPNALHASWQPNMVDHLIGDVQRMRANKLMISSGADFQVAADGNYHHRHQASAGDCPPIPYDHAFVIPEAFVDEMGAKLEEARGRPARLYRGVVPATALDDCEHSHIAGNESKAKTTGRQYDDKGIMALVCRHDIPLLICNITSSGEGQKLIFALLVEFSKHIPSNATVDVLYDIGCTSDRTRQLVGVQTKVVVFAI
jgi:hypothetical protein